MIFVTFFYSIEIIELFWYKVKNLPAGVGDFNNKSLKNCKKTGKIADIHQRNFEKNEIYIPTNIDKIICLIFYRLLFLRFIDFFQFQKFKFHWKICKFFNNAILLIGCHFEIWMEFQNAAFLFTFYEQLTVQHIYWNCVPFSKSN